MSLGRNKRGIEWSTFIEIILVIVATGFIIGVFSVAAGRADEKTSENLCRGFNALRYGTQQDYNVKGVPIVRFNVAPRTCKTIDKKDVPSKDYVGHVKGTQEGAKAELRDIMARCWWMWLEGNQRDMFSTSTLSIDEKCFICYSFSIDESVKPISYADFSVSLNEPYYAVDSTDKCAPGGQGGLCMDSCNEEFSKEVPSNKCVQKSFEGFEGGRSGGAGGGADFSEGTSQDIKATLVDSTKTQSKKCCVSENECENKGGKCLDGPLGEYTIYYKNWKCSKGNRFCYIKLDKTASYLDYIQGTRGVNGGAGKLLFGDNEGFKPNQKYAITFLSPGKEWNAETLVGIGTTGAVGGTTIYYTAGSIIAWLGSGVATGGLTIAGVVIATGLTTASYYFTSQQTGSINDINYVMISKYDTVKTHCAVESGVGEK